MRLILLGPPGVGKGTLANLVKDKYGLLHISTGDILREEMKSGSELGEQVKGYVESGGLVPDEVIIAIIENKLNNSPEIGKGYLLDGFPRTEAQAQALDNILERLSLPVDHAVYLEAGLPVILERLTGRRICRQCGAIYHVKNMPSRQEGVCDACSGELYQRPDDNEETITKRMDVYVKNTTPIIDYYERQCKLMKLNSEVPSTELFSQLISQLDDKKTPDQDKISGRA